MLEPDPVGMRDRGRVTVAPQEVLMTALVGLLCIAIQRRTAYLSRRQWKQLGHPDAVAAVQQPTSPEATTTVTRVPPPAIEGKRP
jgi:hypothetical protein